MSGHPSVLVSREASVATLLLNRPDVGNAMNLDLLQAFAAAARDVAEDESVRCVVLRGQGRFFCVGGDVKSFAEAGNDAPALVTQLAANLHQGMLLLADMPKPLVIAVNGAAAGAGFALAMIGDVVLAAGSAQFSTAYTTIGVTPDGGMTWLLPRLIGLRRAQELALTGRRVDAEEAARMGLVTRVVEDGALDQECRALAQSLASGPTGALGKTRRLLMSSFESTLEDRMSAEALGIAEAVGSDNGREGVAALLAKRKPVFR